MPSTPDELPALLALAEEVYRTMPTRDVIRQKTPENLAWRGHAAALVGRWNGVRAVSFRAALNGMNAYSALEGSPAADEVVTTIHEVLDDLRFQVRGPLAVVVEQGRHFEYFDEVRRLIEATRDSLFFIDPYLDAEFVSRYFPLIPTGVHVKLLTDNRAAAMKSAVEVWISEHGGVVEMRRTAGLHDRFVVIDDAECYHSGASFKDGPRNASATIVRVVDAVDAILTTYRAKWAAADVIR